MTLKGKGNLGPPVPSEALSRFHPAVRAWFSGAFPGPTPVQEQGWPAVARGENTLLLAPTGSGKTLAAFLACLDDLVGRLDEGSWTKGIHTLYVSPLKALNNDIERNLQAPLAGIAEAAEALGRPLPAIQAAVRTGDTPSAARQAMTRKPPHVLITTPESLYLLLTAESSRHVLRTVRYVIVDEIHAVAGSKRGAHLALSLERLEHLADAPPVRVGLSATQRPLDRIARFLGGAAWHGDALQDRPVTIVDAGGRKDLDLEVRFAMKPGPKEAGTGAWPDILEEVKGLVDQHRTTLVFANSRRVAERAAAGLNSFWPDGGDPVRAHHGSMSRVSREQMEAALKAGDVPALVATGSLELGIDVGHVDLVVLLQSPKGVSRGLQRVGRAGHIVGETSRGRIFATHREDLVESAVVARAMREGAVEETRIPENPLDVLAQQVVAEVASQEWRVEDLYRLYRQAAPYRELPRRAFAEVLELLAGKYPAEAFRELRPRIAWDRVADALTALPGSRLLALRNGGTIPERGNFPVFLQEGGPRIGELDEEFVFESRPGDVFQLGTRTWRILQVTEDRVVVADAPGETPSLPFWKGDTFGRPYELGVRVGRFRRELAERLDALDAREWLTREHHLDARGAEEMLAYFRRQRDAAGVIPDADTVLVETWRDEIGDVRVAVLTGLGQRVNAPLALVLRARLTEQTGVDVQAVANDEGILMRVPDADAPPPVDLLKGLTPDIVERQLLEDIEGSPLFGSLFRENAERALLLPRSQREGRTPLWLQRLRAKDLLQVARRFPEFPILVETYRDALQDGYDLPHLKETVARLASGSLRVAVRVSDVPSPFTASLQYDFTGEFLYGTDTPRAERQARQLRVSRDLLKEVLAEADLRDLLRPEVIASLEADLQGLAEGRRARSPDELAQLLARLGDLPLDELLARCEGDGAAWVEELLEAQRIVPLLLPGGEGEPRYCAVERFAALRHALAREAPPESALLYRWLVKQGGAPDHALGDAPGGARVVAHLRQLLEAMRVLPFPTADGGTRYVPVETQVPAAFREPPETSEEEALRDLLGRYLAARGPTPTRVIAARYGLTPSRVESLLGPLASRGQITYGPLLPGGDGAEWCDRANLEALHRMTLGALRREVAPATPGEFQRFLLAWQGVLPEGARRAGAAGARHVLALLQGYRAPGETWERDLLRVRLREEPEVALRRLMLTGDALWVGEAPGNRFFPVIRGSARPWLREPQEPLPPDAEAVLEALREGGASYASDLRAITGFAEERVAEALLALLRTGLATNDAYEALAPLLRVPEGQRAKVTRALRSGRWSLTRSRAILGPEGERPVEAVTLALLARYGVLHKELWDREELPVTWAEAAGVLRGFEMRGAHGVRRGQFVEGAQGVQYALAEAMEALRALRTDAPAHEEDAAVVLNAWDPALMLFPGLSWARVPSTQVVVKGGAPVLALEAWGRRVTVAPGASPEHVREALAAWVALLARPGAQRPKRRLEVATWDGAPVLESAGRAPLEALGFFPENGQLFLYASQAGPPGL